MQNADSKVFYSDIEAARIAGLPVELGSRSLIQPVQNSSAIARAQELPQGRRHQAALTSHATLGTMVPVFNGLTARAIAVEKYTEIVRRTGWYLVAVLLVAVLGLLHFKYYVLPSYETLREDMRLVYQITKFSLDMFPYVTPAIFVIGALLILNLCLLLSGKLGFILSIFGGRRFVRTSVLSAAAESLPLLRQCGMSAEDASLLTTELYSLDPVGAEKLAAAADGSQYAEACHTYSQYWAMVAENCFQRAQVLVPIVGLTVVGGAVLFLYGLLIYAPLVGLIFDLLEANKLG